MWFEVRGSNDKTNLFKLYYSHFYAREEFRKMQKYEGEIECACKEDCRHSKWGYVGLGGINRED